MRKEALQEAQLGAHGHCAKQREIRWNSATGKRLTCEHTLGPKLGMIERFDVLEQPAGPAAAILQSTWVGGCPAAGAKLRCNHLNRLSWRSLIVTVRQLRTLSGSGS